MRQLPLLTGPVKLRLSMVREEGMPVPQTIRTPADASSYADELRDGDREQFAVILLNSKNAVIGMHVTAIGTLDSCLVSPSNVFKAALLANAAGLVLIHTHPSGDPNPSAEDIRITRQLIEAGRIMDIKVLDHVVLGGALDKFYSMRESSIVQF